MASWLATVLGLGGGMALALFFGQAIVPWLIRRSPAPRRTLRFALAGTLVAFLPAILLAIVAGGTLGGAWGRSLGIAVGTALTFAVVLLLGAAAGIVLARVLRGPADGLRD